jgi:hypothetical protein
MGIAKRFCFLLLAVAATATPLFAQSTTVQFKDGQLPTTAYRGTNDTQIKEQTPNLNFGNLPQLRVTTADIGGGQTWSLVRWDISGHVPPGCVVTEARVRLYVDPDDPGPAIPIYGLLRNWVEGNDTPGSGATWNTFNGATTWQLAGAEGALDRGTVSLGSMPGGAGFQEVTLNATGLALVQQWADNPALNLGVILRGGSSDGVNYASRNNSDPTLRPQLQVSFQLPTFAAGTGGTATVNLREGQAGYTGTTDTRIGDGGATNNNYGASNQLRVDGNGNDWRSIIRWDLSSIPTNATVTDARLSLYVFDTGGSGSIYQCLRPWVEGNQIGAGGSGADWVDYDTTNDWGTQGANNTTSDYVNTLLGSLPGTPDETIVTAILTGVGRGVVQNWIANPAQNFGFLIRPTNTDQTRWRSRNHGTINTRPQLTITYSTPPLGITRTATGNGSWSNPATWTPAGVPAPTDRAVVDGGTVTLDGGGTHTVTRIDVINGGTLDVSTGTLSTAAAGLVAVLPTSTLRVSGTGTLRCLGRFKVITANLAIAGGTLRMGALPFWVGAGSTFTTTGGVLTADVATTPMVATINGTLRMDSLTVRNPDANGFRVSRYAILEYMRGSRFEGVAAGAGSILLTVEQDSLCLNAPANYFDTVAAGQFNVRLLDTEPTTANVALNLENRGAATSGPGAGPGFEQEANGSAVNWVHSAPDSTRGKAVGFAQTAYDLNTYAYYATYVAFCDVDVAGTDRIYVFDHLGEGVNQGYWFDIPASAGDLVDGFWWDQQGTTRIVWAVTTTGRVFRFTNPGAGAGAIPPDPGFPTTITDPGAVVFTSSPLTADTSLVYASGTSGGAFRFFAIDATNGTLAWSIGSGLADPVTSDLGSSSLNGVTTLYAGAGQVFGTGANVLQEDFDASSGPFGYQDDTFRGTSNPGNASGDHSTTGGQTGGRVRVTLGDTTTNMSGGWVATFNVPGATPRLVEVRFAYRLISSERYEFDEFQQIMASVDTQLLATPPLDYVFQFTGDGNGLPDMDSGWVNASFRLALTPGNHTLTLGGYANKSTEGPEVAEMYFDDVFVDTIDTSGRIYRIDTQTQLVDLEDATPTGPITGSVFPAFGVGLFAVDLNGAVHGIDPTTMLPLPGWPIQTGTALLSDVWLDFFTGDVYFGNETGQLFGYTLAGGLKPGFPILNPFGTSSPIRASALYDSGLLWASNDAGAVVAVDVSTTATASPDYRFGGIPISRVSQDGSFRINVATSCGQFLVLDTLTDPTP